MKPLRIAAAIAALALAGAVFGRPPFSPGTMEPPLMAPSPGRLPSEDPRELLPAVGAIKGGSIVPGENGGLPKTAPSTDPAERDKRCSELSGTLRDDCLLKEQNAN